MMNNNVNDAYFKAFFKDWEYPFTVTRGAKGWYCLTVPLLYCDHDLIEVFVHKNEDGTFDMTDDGETFGVHCYAGEGTRKDLLERIVKDSVKYDEGEITATATEETFQEKLMEMVSTIIAVDYTAHALRG